MKMGVFAHQCSALVGLIWSGVALACLCSSAIYLPTSTTPTHPLTFREHFAFHSHSRQNWASSRTMVGLNPMRLWRSHLPALRQHLVTHPHHMTLGKAKRLPCLRNSFKWKGQEHRWKFIPRMVGCAQITHSQDGMVDRKPVFNGWISALIVVIVGSKVMQRRNSNRSIFHSPQYGVHTSSQTFQFFNSRINPAKCDHVVSKYGRRY